MKKTNWSQARPYIIAAVPLGLTVSWVVSKMMEKHEEKKVAETAADHQIAWTHYNDQLDAISSELDRRIEIARNALAEDDVYLWDKELGE